MNSALPLIIVTGAAGGLGTATCELLLEKGYAVLGIDHNTSRFAKLVAKYKNAPLYPLQTNVEDPRLIDLVQETLPSQHPVKGLVYIAAQSKGDMIYHLSDDDWDHSFNVNVTPAMKLARFLAPKMQQNGSGSIVNIGSPVGIVGARKPSYAASKAALTGLTMSLARNLGSDNIRANLLLPGPMITPLTEDWSSEKRERIAQTSFLKRLCEPTEVAHVIAFLLSDQASYMTGTVLDVTAGTMFGH